jgi:hypothetical protein
MVEMTDVMKEINLVEQLVELKVCNLVVLLEY